MKATRCLPYTSCKLTIDQTKIVHFRMKRNNLQLVNKTSWLYMCNKINAHQLIFKNFPISHEYLFTFMILFGYKEYLELTIPFSLLW